MSAPAETIVGMSRSVGARTAFVAREEQVTVLLAAVDRAAGGEPGLVLLGADAGVGKTRLLTHTARLARERDAVVVISHCLDLGGIGLPYLPFADALHQLAADGSPTAATVAEVAATRPALHRLLPAGAGVPDGADEQTVRLQLFEGVASALAAVGRPGAPLVLVLEDLHWADDSSRDLLRFLVARLRTEHVLLIGSYRADDLHRRHPLRPVLAELGRHPRVERVDLPPFTDAELREFTTALSGAPLPEEALCRIVQRSEGNAYYAEELTEAGTEGTDLPGTLADVLRARLEQLDPAAQRLTRVASAAGRRVDEPLLRAVAGRSGAADEATAGFDDALREAVAHHVLVGEGGRIAFRHALLAEAVYTDLLPGEQVALHRDYLAALTADPALASPAERVHHALRAHDTRTALVASWQAAQEAGRLLAPAEELRHLETVLRLWPAVPTAAQDVGAHPVHILLAAAATAHRSGDGDRAVALAREAVRTAATASTEAAPSDGSDQDLVELETVARTALARHLLGVDRVTEALEQSRSAVGAPDDATTTGLGAPFPVGPTSARAWALATYARSALNSDLDDRAEQAGTAAVAEARAAGAADAEADALISLAVLVVEDEDRAAHLLATALDRARTAGDMDTELRCTYNLATNRYYAGDLAAAAATAAEGISRATSEGLSWSVYGVELRLFAEIVAYALGDLTPPEPAAAPPHAEGTLTGVRLYAAVARGDADAVDRGLALLRPRHPDPMIVLISGGCTVDALTWAGRGQEAVTLAHEVIEDISRSWSDHFLGGIWLSALGLAALADLAEDDRLAGRDPAARLAVGDALLARAETTAERGRPRGGRLGPEGRGWLERARAEHGRLHGRSDPEAWRRAAAELDYGYDYEVARSRWRWAQALLGVGDRDAAREQAAAALDVARRIGAVPLATAVADLARRARLDLPGVPTGGGDVLTAREAEVLALVAEGLSNRQIGERLFISGKTVSVHVSNLLAKLGAGGRAEAVTIAHRRGLLGT